MSENSGGPHTLAYGVTTNHVLGLEAVLPDGTVINTGGKYDELPGYDLTGLLVGSEGTMVLVTKIIVRLMRKPEMVKTILAIYDRPEDAGDTVAEITARAITPVAVEMLDGVLLRMVEEADARGLSHGCRGRAADRARRHQAKRSRSRSSRFARPACACRRARVSRGSRRRRARPAVERPQERFRRGGPVQPGVLRAGRRGAAHANRADAALHRANWPSATA